MVVHIEGLEPRKLLSAVINNGVLEIVGTSGSDTYLITQVNGLLHVTENNVFLGVFAVDDDGYENTCLIKLWAGGGHDTVVLDVSVSYNSELFGEGGHDSITGGSAQDEIDGGPGSDVMHGGAEDDAFINASISFGIVPLPDKDEYFGDAGIEDSVRYTGRPSGVVVTLDDVADDGYATSVPGGNSPEGDNVHSDVEDVWGTDSPDYLVGNGFSNNLAGFGGNDSLYGMGEGDTLQGGAGNDSMVGSIGDDWLLAGNGNDYLSGGSGNDRLQGQAGADIMWGGFGNDTVDYENNLAGVTASLDGLQNDGSVGENDWIKPDVENLKGCQHDDWLVGNDGDNLLDGHNGDDVLIGAGGNDTLVGGFGNDELFGGAGDDSLDGGFDDDTLWGGAGLDVLVGGPGVNVLNP